MLEEPVEQETAEESSLRALRQFKGKCFFSRVGYWTYEVCPWRRVRQYHSENPSAAGVGVATPKKVHIEYSLGTYAEGQDRFDGAARIYTQHYASGTDGRSAMEIFTKGMYAPSPPFLPVCVF